VIPASSSRRAKSSSDSGATASDIVFLLAVSWPT
jgi:hypothetical protein